MTTNTNAALISHLQALGDRAYCDYIAKMKTNECLGWEEKVRTKKFGQAELTAHTKAGELLGKHRAFAEAVAALTTAAAVPAEGVVMVPVELANRVQESLGEFLMDHGWSQRDMDTSDEFGAVLLAADPKAEPVPAGEREELREGASYESMNLAAMVLSDCGHSSNYQPLLERVAGRIDRHVERLLTAQREDLTTRAQAAPAAVAGPGTYVQLVPDHCDRIVWRNHYHRLPLESAVPTTQAAPQPAVQQGWDIDAAVEKAWGRFQAAMDKDEPLPPPSIHATAHYGTWLGREAHWHDEPKAGAFRNAARMLAVLEAEIRRLHAELIAAQPAAPVAQGDAREETNIGKAVNRAARDLPEGWEIRIDLERHAGVVHLIDPEGNETMIEGGGELFSDQISTAIDAARSQAKEGA